MRDNFTGRPVTMASLRKSIYPSPVWQAHLSNGETLRLSFNCPGGISTEEMMARARFQAANFIQWTGAPIPSELRREPEAPYPRDLRIMRLYLEDRRQPGTPWIIAGDDLDPWQDHRAFKRPRTTVKQIKATLNNVMLFLDGKLEGRAAREALVSARELLAA